MKIINDEKGQGASEYILLFGDIIIIASAVLQIYSSYFTGQTLNSSNDINTVRSKINTT